MKLNKNVHKFLIAILLIGCVVIGIGLDWNLILEGQATFSSVQGFLVSVLVLSVLSFQYYGTHLKDKSNLKNL